MKNKIIILFISIFTSFFLFSSNVLAETYNMNTPLDITNLSQEQLDTMIATAKNSGANTYNGYLIRYAVSTNPKFAIIGYNTLTISGNSLTLTNCRRWNYNSDYTSSSFSYNYGTCNWKLSGTIQDTFIMWSSNDLFLSNNNDTYNYTYIDKTFSFPSENDLKFYTTTEIRDWYYTDPHQTLTNFVSLVIDKLNFITNYFTSNYIYLSMFVIFIFYFVILLIRRFI